MITIAMAGMGMITKKEMAIITITTLAMTGEK
jgi:hypothetical protein